MHTVSVLYKTFDNVNCKQYMVNRAYVTKIYSKVYASICKFYIF